MGHVEVMMNPTEMTIMIIVSLLVIILIEPIVKWMNSIRAPSVLPPRMSLEVVGNMLEIGLAQEDGPELIHIPKQRVAAMVTDAIGNVTIYCDGGQSYRGSGLSQEACNTIRRDLGWVHVKRHE